MTIVPAFLAGIALIGAGAFAAAYRQEAGARLVALPVLAAGVAVLLAAASRFSGLRQDSNAGEELAALACAIALPAVILGSAWLRRETGS